MTVRGEVAREIAPGGSGPAIAAPEGDIGDRRPAVPDRSADRRATPRPRARRALRAAAGAVGLLLLGLGAGFGLFVLRVAAPPTPAGPSSITPAPMGSTPLGSTPGIAVLTGGPDRVERGLALLSAREDARLLISGVGHSVVPADLGAVGERIALGRTATSTRGNALEIAAWARETGIREITVVTAGFHMPRALLELRRALPEGDFRPYPVAPHRPRPAVLLREYAKLLGGALGLSALLDRPRAPESPLPETRS